MKIRLKTATSLKTAAQRAGRITPNTASKGSFYSPDDPDGSYTGVAKDGGKPIQDADDL